MNWLAAKRRDWQEWLWDVDPQQYGRWGRFWLRQLQVTSVVAHDFIADNCLLRASALTFATLLSIVPLLAIMFALLKGFGAEIDLEIFVLDHVALGSHEVVDAIFTYISNSNLARLGAAGVISLLLTVLTLLLNVEESFNHIWRVRETRRLYRRFADYFSVVLLGPLFILAAVSMTTSITSHTLLKHLLEVRLIGPLLLDLFKLFPFFIMWAAFAFLYLFIPNAKVSVRAALIGGIFGGTLWQLVQWGYVTFQIGVGRYNAIYGTMAALPIFMVWLYLSWLIVLLGLEMAFAQQNLGTLRQERGGGEVNADGRECAVLALLLVAAEGFCRGERAATAEELAVRVGIPSRLAHSIISQLVRLELLVEVVTPADRAAAFQLARAPETVGLAELFDRLRHDGPSLPSRRSINGLRVVEGVRDELVRAQSDTLAGRTLRDLVSAADESEG